MLRRLALAACLVLAPRIAVALVHPTAEELTALATVADPQLSPDGTRLAYTLETQRLDPKAQPADGDTKGGWTRERQVWLLELSGAPPRALTTGADMARAPRWSPDGRTLAFLRAHDGKSRIELLSLQGGEPQPLATGDLEPQQFRWSPDGRSIAFTAEPPRTAAEKEQAWRSGEVENWAERFRPTALWIVPVEGAGAPRRISTGTENVSAFEWSPDGSRFAVLVSATSDLYDVLLRSTPRVIAAKDGALVRTLDSTPRLYLPPAWSPDGQHVALVTTNTSLSMTNWLEIADVAKGTVTPLSKGLDVTYASIRWDSDPASVLAVISDHTRSRIVRIDAQTSDVADLGLGHRVVDSSLELDPKGHRLVFLSSIDTQPDVPTALSLDGAGPQVLTDPHPEVRSWSLGVQQIVHWTNAEGTALEGLLTTPRGAHGPTPLIVFPHGGPDDISTIRFSGLTEYFAAHGYAVFRPNYRGSLGYGHAIYAANRGRFGEIETADIESGVDALIADRLADPNRLFFGGWSWGGYISAWTLTHQKRYRACVVGAGVNDVMYAYSTSDINHGASAAWEYQGNPWYQLDHFDRANPIRFAKNATTPTLILHGQADHRVPFDEGVILYRALADVGCPVTFYAYPREDHGFVEPAHRVHMARVWLDWYDHHQPGMAPRVAARATTATAARAGVTTR